MKSSTFRAFGVSVALQVLCCGPLMGQMALPSPGPGEFSNPVLAVSAVQSEGTPRSSHSDDTFVIGDDDVLAINVWKDQDLTKQVTVRTDGKISLPLIGDIQAAGRTPLQLEIDLTDKLKSYVNDPQVTVIVQEIHSLKFNILGQVTKPGSYPLTAGTTIVDAIAVSGGLRDFAKKKGIYVLRPGATGAETRYEFNYQDFIKGKNVKQNILLKPHDTVVVP
jgi:polysaccharide export outer membrane protein